MNQPTDQKTETPHGDAARDDAHHASVAGQFVKELMMFLAGLFLGFFWYAYSNLSPSPETHIIIGLVVIIVCLTRYVMLLRQKHDK